MKLLFLDWETQSDDPSSTNPTEVGAVLDDGIRQEIVEELIYEPNYPPQTPEIVEITGITDEMLRAKGRSQAAVLPTILDLVAKADIVLAHNAQFDSTVYRMSCKRLGLEPKEPNLGWLCTVTDLPWPKKFKCKKLSHLAYDNGVFVDPSTLHRALDDVYLLRKLFQKVWEPKLAEVINYWNTPWTYIRAIVPAPWEDGGVGTTHAKKLGFTWEKIWGVSGIDFPKKWVKRVKESELHAEKARCPFQITRLDIT